MRNHFITALIQLFKIENNPVTIQALDRMTAHIKPEQYAEFIERCGEKQEYKRPLEIIKSVSDKYMDEIKSELFKDVEADAKELSKKLEALFVQIDCLFMPSLPSYDKKIVQRFEFPSKYIREAKIKAGEYWSNKDVYLVGKIGLETLFRAFNDPYRQMDDLIIMEMKNALTLKYLMPANKKIEKPIKNLEIKRIGK